MKRMAVILLVFLSPLALAQDAAVEYWKGLAQSRGAIIREQTYLLSLSEPEREAVLLLPIIGVEWWVDPITDFAYSEFLTDFYVCLPREASLLEQVTILSQKLSWYRFGQLPMEVVGLEMVDGLWILSIDLQEETPPTEYTWMTYFFQGSTGGAMTAVTLIETYLQREYTGHWIDAVSFSYQGEQDAEFDHIGGLLGIHYRKEEKP